jgi:hypothetical protein
VHGNSHPVYNEIVSAYLAVFHSVEEWLSDANRQAATSDFSLPHLEDVLFINKSKSTDEKDNRSLLAIFLLLALT